jgi:glycerophosphoryl diester phosphodiesterase
VTLTWGIQPRPLVIGHRGASADAPENTLAAFRLAEAQGADGIELDVMRCASGEIVVFHDDDLVRLGKRAGLTRKLGMSELRTIDLGGGERIPELGQVFDAIGPELLVNVELKSAPTWAERVRDDGLARGVAELLRARGVGDRVIVSSFDPLLLGRFRKVAPEIATGLLFAHDQARPLKNAWAAPLLRPVALHPEAALVDAVAMTRWRDQKLAVNVWTVDDPAELKCLAALGVDGLITNRPAATKKALNL